PGLHARGSRPGARAVSDRAPPIQATGPLAERIRQGALLTLVAALALVGVGVATVLHLQALRGLDRALVAAADAHAIPHPDADPVDEAGGVRSVPVHFLGELPPGPAHAVARQAL